MTMNITMRESTQATYIELEVSITGLQSFSLYYMSSTRTDSDLVFLDNNDEQVFYTTDPALIEAYKQREVVK